jgi:hypothetical protein
VQNKKTTVPFRKEESDRGREREKEIREGNEA